MAKGSPSVGSSSFSGTSSFASGKNEAKEILGMVVRFHEDVINKGILEWNAQIQSLARTELDAREEFKTVRKEMSEAKGLAEQGDVRDALENIRSAYQDYCYNPNVSSEEKLKLSKIFEESYPQLLNEENITRSKELQKMCDNAIKECEKEGISSDAWEEFKRSIKEAYDNAKDKTPMGLTMVKCKANLLGVAKDNLRLAGVNARIFYGPTEQYGYIVVPSAGGEIERLAHAAVIDAAVKSAQTNLLSEESMDMVMQLRGNDDRREITGLSMVEAELIMESLYGKNAPVVIKEPESVDRGEYSLIYSKKDEQLVNSVVLQSLLQTKGAGYSAHINEILRTNYMARKGTDLLLTKIAEGHDTFGYVVDADHPEHHLLITKEGITEIFENGEKDVVKFDKIPNQTNYSIEIKERIMQMAPRVQFIPAKQAKECGLTRDDFLVSDELKKALVVRNPNNTVKTASMETPEATAKYAREVQFVMSAQAMYGRYAAGQARLWLPKDADLQTTIQYVAQNTQEFLSGFKRQMLDNIERRNLPPEEKQKAIQEADLMVQALKTWKKDEIKSYTINDAMQEIYDRVVTNQQVQAHDYKAPEFTEMELSSKRLDNKDLMEFKKDMALVNGLLDAYKEKTEQAKEQELGKTADQTQEKQEKDAKTQNHEQEKQPEKPSREEIISKNENTVQAYTQQLSSKISPKKAEAIAVCNVFMDNMKSALLDQEDLPPADQYLQKYHIIPEREAVRIDQEVQQRLGINLEQYEHMPKDQQDQYRQYIETVIKDDVQKAVSEGMKERTAQKETFVNREEER